MRLVAFDEIVYAIAVARDISERLQAEQELSLYRLHLEDLVEQRTTQLERSNRDLEMFAYSVSHDLRAPLRHIEGFARILEEKVGSQDESVQRYFGKIYRASERMKNLIGDLLTYSRLGRRQLNLLEVSLDEIVQEMIAQHRLDLDDRQVEWKVGPLGVVEADPDMLKIVFDNLIANAIKFTRPRDVAVIEIGAEPKGDSVEIYVKDNGVGFDMAYVQKLFGVFQRLHSEDEFPGTGIGLANVKRIVQNHGGEVRAKGGVDHGAIFFITLPRTRKER
jgi:light-regulated signal transduction histidine kinase (bacteriophytochrome)